MGPGRYPQYTRADFGPEAVGSSVHKHYTSPNVKPYGRVKSRMVAGATDPRTQPIITQLSRDNLTMCTLVRKTAKTDEPATTEAASAPEPAAESPVETAEVEIADKAEELNIEVIMAEEPATLEQTKRRLELWNQSTSRKLTSRYCKTECVRLLPSIQITVCEKGASGVTAVKSPGRNLQCPGIQHDRHRAAAVPSGRAEKL